LKEIYFRLHSAEKFTSRIKTHLYAKVYNLTLNNN